MLLSSSVDAVGRGTRHRNTAPPGILEDGAHCEQSLEVLRKGKKVGDMLPTVDVVQKTTACTYYIYLLYKLPCTSY